MQEYVGGSSGQPMSRGNLGFSVDFERVLNHLLGGVGGRGLAMGGEGWFDGDRDFAGQCGYPGDMYGLSPQFYRQLYDFHPLANRVVNLMPDECWQGSPLIYETADTDESTDFEDDVDAIGRNLSPDGTSWYQDEKGSRLHEYWHRLDRLSGIGQFGVMLLGIDDGRNLQDPVDGVEVYTQNRRRLYDTPPSKAEQEQWKKDLTDNAIAPAIFRKLCDAGQEASVLHNAQLDSDKVESHRHSPLDYARAKQEWGKKHGQAVHNTQHAQRQLRTLNKVDGDWLSPFGGTPGSGPFVQGTDGQYGSSYASDSGLGMAPVGAPRGVQGIQAGTMGKPGTAQTTPTGTQFPNPAPGPGRLGAWAGPELSGTDALYFGVQFGPSQRFGAPTKEPRNLLFMRVFDESLVQVVRYEWNINNPRFGLPVMYRITLNDPRQPHSGVGLPLATIYVHWSRVIHVADNKHVSEIFGVNRCRPVLFPLLDIRKMYAASPEGYWRSCFTALSFETHPELGGDVLVDEAKLRDAATQFFEGLQRQLIAKGMTVKPIAPSVVDPTPFIDKQIEAICICLGCPVRVFKGSERGELASSQDDEAWNERKMLRQNYYLTPSIICATIDRFIQIGILSEPRAKVKQAEHSEPTGRMTPGEMAPTEVPEKQEDDDELPMQAGAGGVGTQQAGGGPGGRGASPAAGGKAAVPGNKGAGGNIPSGVGAGSKNGAGNAPKVPPVANAQSIRNRPGRWLIDNSRGRDPHYRRGTWIVNAQGKVVGQQTKGGYSVEWPDLEALSAKDKAAIALQETQALAAFVSGNVESVLPIKEYYVHIMGWDEEQADAVIGGAVDAQKEQEQVHMDMADEHGFQPKPPAGFADKPQPPIIVPGQPGVQGGQPSAIGGKSGGAPTPGKPATPPKPPKGVAP